MAWEPIWDTTDAIFNSMFAGPRTYPPVPDDELVNCRAYENLDRVVVTSNAVFGREKNGNWIKLK